VQGWGGIILIIHPITEKWVGGEQHKAKSRSFRENGDFFWGGRGGERFWDCLIVEW